MIPIGSIQLLSKSLDLTRGSGLSTNIEVAHLLVQSLNITGLEIASLNQTLVTEGLSTLSELASLLNELTSLLDELGLLGVLSLLNTTFVTDEGLGDWGNNSLADVLDNGLFNWGDNLLGHWSDDSLLNVFNNSLRNVVDDGSFNWDSDSLLDWDNDGSGFVDGDSLLDLINDLFWDLSHDSLLNWGHDSLGDVSDNGLLNWDHNLLFNWGHNSSLDWSGDLLDDFGLDSGSKLFLIDLSFVGHEFLANDSSSSSDVFIDNSALNDSLVNNLGSQSSLADNLRAVALLDESLLLKTTLCAESASVSLSTSLDASASSDDLLLDDWLTLLDKSSLLKATVLKTTLLESWLSILVEVTVDEVFSLLSEATLLRECSLLDSLTKDLLVLYKTSLVLVKKGLLTEGLCLTELVGVLNDFVWVAWHCKRKAQECSGPLSFHRWKRAVVAAL